MKALLLTALLAPLFAQPKIENAKLETRAVNGSLDASFHALVAAQTDPAWIGYTVAQIPGERSMCATVSLEGAPEFVMLYRVAAGQVEKIRNYSTDCLFDAGGLPVFWLTGIDGEQSARLLSSYIPEMFPPKDAKEPRQLANSALLAIGRHRDSVTVLIEIVRRTKAPSQVRQEAMRWLGRSKDPRAVKFFEDILATR